MPPLAQVATFVLLFDTTLARVATFVLLFDATFGLGSHVRATVWCHLWLGWQRSCYCLMPPLAQVATFMLLIDTTFGSGSHVRATV